MENHKIKKRNKPTNYQKKFTVRIEENVLEQFNRKVKENGHNRSSLIRSWIYKYINDKNE